MNFLRQVLLPKVGLFRVIDGTSGPNEPSRTLLILKQVTSFCGRVGNRVMRDFRGGRISRPPRNVRRTHIATLPRISQSLIGNLDAREGSAIALTIFATTWIIASLTTGSIATAQDTAPQNPQRLVMLTTYLTAPTRIATATKMAADAKLELQLLTLENSSEAALSQAIAQAKLLLVDAPHSSVEKPLVDKFAEAISQGKAPYVWIGELESIGQEKPLADQALALHRGMAPSVAQTVREHWRFGGKANTQKLFNLLAKDDLFQLADNSSLAAAERQPDMGFYHPDWPNIETELSKVESTLKLPEQIGLVAIAINGAVLTADDTQWLDSLIAELRSRKIASYAFFGPRQDNELFERMTRTGEANSKSAVNLVINAALVFRPNDTKAQLDRLGIPVLHTIPSLAMNAEAWKSSKEGVAFEDISYYYASSELAGMIDPVLITARDSATGSLQPIVEQVQALADKAASTILLQNTPVESRRVAIMVYNYPLGEGNFGASFLNVPKSLENIVRAMKQSGYTAVETSSDELTEKVKQNLAGFYDPQALQSLLAKSQAEFLPLEAYEKWFRELPETAQQRIEQYWGSPSKAALSKAPSASTTTTDVSESELGFAIPVVRLGNISVLAQPLRHEIGAQLDAELRKKRIGHRSNVPLSHNYLATYLWIRQQFQAHAVMHLGTHGTVEWAPGKERGLAVNDDPYLALGSLPNVYPYIMDNLGEALTAKRRGRAIIVSHLTPMFTPAGFRPGLHQMHDWMHDWELAAPGPIRQQLEKSLVAAFIDHRLDKDLGWSPEKIAAEFEAFMEVLHPYLDDIAQSAQPQGLAVLGEAPDADRRLGMVMQMLRKPLIEGLGEDIDEVFLLDYEKVINSRPARWLRLALKDAQAASVLDLRKIDDLSTDTHTSVPNRAEDKSIDPAVLLALAEKAQALDRVLSENTEIESLLAALSGKHISSSYGGDPVRNPESLPTGKNLYGFDPSRVPTQQAWQFGQSVLDDWLVQYRSDHNDAMPKKIAFSLWAGETMRHQGIMESQVLYALGVKPVWDANGRVTGIETIASDELKRDRIDVLLSVTGSYRDQFPLVMQWIDKAIRDVAELAEPGNAIAASKDALLNQLLADGIDEKQARRLSLARIFSNEAGVYGTGLNDAVNASDLWQTQQARGGDAEMAKLFVDRMGYAFGEEANASKLFAAQLGEVDAAFASRSSNTYGMLTSDDPFAYIGGLALAARTFSNKSPELYMQNLRDESEVIVDSAAGAIAKEMQSRYLHPQWIKSQMAEGYSGTLQVLKTTQFMWGWQVTAPETIRSDQWDSMFDVYVQDKYQLGTMEWMKRDNQAALAQMLERMLDAVRLGYWPASESTQQALMEAYEESKRASGVKETHAEVANFVTASMKKVQAKLPDLNVKPSGEASDASPSVASVASETVADSGTQVSGLELKPQEAEKSPTSPAPLASSPLVRWVGLLAIVGLIAYGVIRQQRRLSRRNGAA